MKTTNSNWLTVTLWTMFLVTLGIVVYRSATLSMTHDESATWLYIHDRNIFWSLFDSGAWGTANNHYLNSVLIHFFTSIWGDEEWVIRLPNTLAYILYGSSSILLIQRIFNKPGTQVLAAALIFGNVYLIDFFSQARGYGMSVAFHMTAILYLYEWINKRRLKYLFFLFLFLGLASLSLFTHLIYLPVYSVMVYVVIWWQNKSKSIPFRFSELFVPVVSILILGLLVYVPFSTLSGNAEFQWGTPMLEESLKGLINDSLQGRKYLGTETSGVIGVLLLISVFIGMWKHYRTGEKIQQSILFHSGLLGVFILMVVAMVFSKWVLGTLYPVERKSTLYLPLIFILVPYSIEFFRNHKRSFILGIVFSSMLFIHFIDKLELDRTREWYYDYQTREYILSVVDQVQENEVTIGMHWTFFWSATYYIRNGNHDHVKLFRYHDNQQEILPADYLIVNNKEYHQFSEDYDIIKGPNRSMVSLLKKK